MERRLSCNVFFDFLNAICLLTRKYAHEDLVSLPLYKCARVENELEFGHCFGVLFFVGKKKLEDPTKKRKNDQSQ